VRPLFLSLFFLLICSVFSLSQHKAGSYEDLLKRYTEANRYYQQGLYLYRQKNYLPADEERLNRLALNKFKSLDDFPSFPGADSLLFFSYLKTAELEQYFDSLKPALNYYNKAISVQKRTPSIADSFLFKPYLFCGLIFHNTDQEDSASLYLGYAEKIQERYSQKLEESERLYNNFGVFYFESGNYRLAKNYFQKAIEVLPESHPSFQNLFVNYTINLASSLYKLEQYDSSLKILYQLLPYGEHINEIHNNIGLIHLYNGFPNKAIQEFSKLAYGSAKDIGLNNDRANAWLHLKEFDSAYKYLQIALEKNEAYNGNSLSIDHGLSLKYLGDLEFQLNRYPRALQYFQSALHQFYPGYRDTGIYDNPTRFSGIFSYINVFNTLISKAETFHLLYEQSGNIKWAEGELNTYDASFQLLEYVERTYESDEAKLFLEKTKYQVHAKPIDIALALHQKTGKTSFLEKAFELDQKNKATLLVFNQQQNQLAAASRGVAGKERQLKSTITRLSLKAIHLTNEKQRNGLNQQIRDAEMQLGRLQEELSKTYPSLSVIPSAKSLQEKLLDAHTQLISYHLSENKLTVFSITSTSFKCEQKAVDAAFPRHLENYILQLRDIEGNKTDTAFERKLHSLLFDKVIDKDHRHLVIIPDDELNYLPFEAIKTQNGYMVQDYTIQYQYSAALLKKEQTDFSDQTTLGFAPFATASHNVNSLHFNRLPFSSEEITNLKGQSFIGEKATKKAFTEAISKYNIIHLATHAVTNDSADHLSFIAFAPGTYSNKEDYLLYTQEIYNLSLQSTRLVILSACETGNGRLVRGEGIMSMNRAFAYAGCPDVIASLWKADDFSTSFLAKKIHKYLAEGLPVADAVTKAKCDYLESREINPRMKNPAYWANLIFIGNYAPEDHNKTWWLLIPAALLVLVLFLKRKWIAAFIRPIQRGK
jgi:CHAT domain-containing protein